MARKPKTAATAPAAAANPAPANVLATPPAVTLTADLALKIATEYVAMAVDDAGRSATFVTRARLLATAVGSAMTFAQWDKLIAPILIETFSKTALTTKRQAEYCSRFKVIACAVLTRDDALAPLLGEPTGDYLERVRPLLAAYVLPDGTPMVPPSTDKRGRSASGTGKRGRKPGTPASNKKTPAPAVDTSAAKADDAGHDVSRRHALAVSLMGTEDAGKLLMWVIENDAKAFVLWAKDRQAKSVDTTKAKPAPKAKPEPDAKAKALNAQLLAMANATAPAKANGAAA